MKQSDRDNLLIRLDQKVTNIQQIQLEMKETDKNQWQAIGEVRRDHASTASKVGTISKLMWIIITCITGTTIGIVSKLILAATKGS